MGKRSHEPDTPAKLIEAIGRSELRARLGVTNSAISNVLKDDVLPALWFGPIEEMAAAKGIAVSRDLFRWREQHGRSPGPQGTS